MMDTSSGDESERTMEADAYPGDLPVDAEVPSSVLGSDKVKENVAHGTSPDAGALKDFQLGDCLGKGAFGSVYRALNWGTGETVAIKKIRLADLPKNELRTIMSEIDLLKNLNHPNIVKYQGFKKSSDSLYIILEYCENGSLHTICKNFGKFPENLVALYMSQVLHGLLYLHEQGVIHRDIKGANILTTKEGLVKLADFGVATNAGGLHEASVVGTPYWMAPEVIELSGATTASDIWSLGCTVIELLEGKPPYHKLQPMPALFRIVNDDHPPLPESASPTVLDFLMQCFQKDPNLRVSAKKLLKHPWIISAKRADAVVPIKPTKYDEAVKSVQQWNEALKAPESTTIRHDVRAAAPSPIPRKLPQGAQFVLPLRASTPTSTTVLRGPVEAKKVHGSSDDLDKDNWDDDFASSIGSSALQLPHLKPIDNFAGLLSSDKLKAYATIQSPTSQDVWDNDFEVDSKIEPTASLLVADPPEIVDRTLPVKLAAPMRKSERVLKVTRRNISQSKESVSKTLGKPAQVLDRPLPFKRLSSAFREDGVEDFSDLVPESEIALNKRFQQASMSKRDELFSPKFTHVSDLRNAPSSSAKVGTSVRPPRRQMSRGEDRSSLSRSESTIEIQRYAENIDDEDFSDMFGADGAIVRPKQRTKEADATGNLLTPKFPSSSWPNPEDDEEDDPFAQLEEEFDEMDMETKVARDKHARLCVLVEGLAGSLKTTQSEDVLANLSEQLLQYLFELPDLKLVVISSHGLLPILEVLDNSQRRDVTLKLLKIINAIILDSQEIQETLCFVGGIPIVTKFAHKKYPREIRLEAAAFVRQMYQTSTLTLQMFISCGGLHVLVEFLEEDYDTERDLVLIGVTGVWSVFELQGPTPKNDFCRIFCRSSALYPLSLVLNRVLDEEGELTELAEGRIANIFLIFSQAENHVKESVADRMVLKRVLKDLRRMSPLHQITMLKFIKNLSMLASTLDALQNSNAIEVLTDLLNSSIKASHFREMSNQILNTMYNLCRLSKTRQEDAALNGIIPLLQRIVQTERPLKEFALPILCDMAHSGKVGRTILWQNKGLHFYISLLGDQYWQVTALDAILVWLQEETAKVEEHLLALSFNTAIILCFSQSKTDAFEKLLEPLQKLLRLSPPVASTLAQPALFQRTGQKLYNKKAVVRVNLLRILRSICDASEEQDDLLRSYGLYDAIDRLAQGDPAILVRNMASELLKSSDAASTNTNVRSAGSSSSADGGRARPVAGIGVRRTSSSTGTVMKPTPSFYSSNPYSVGSPGGLTQPAAFMRASGRLPFATSLVNETVPHDNVARSGSNGGSAGLLATPTPMASRPTNFRASAGSSRPAPITSSSVSTVRANTAARTASRLTLDTSARSTGFTANTRDRSVAASPSSAASSNAGLGASSNGGVKAKLSRTSSTSSSSARDRIRPPRAPSLHPSPGPVRTSGGKALARERADNDRPLLASPRSVVASGARASILARHERDSEALAVAKKRRAGGGAGYGSGAASGTSNG